MYVDRVPFLDAVLELKDRLDELHSEEQITDQTYRRKSAFRNLAKAVNRADREVCMVRKQREITAVFVPKDVHILPMASHDVYKGQQVESITTSTLQERHPKAISVFLHRDPWVEIQSIISEKLHLYEKHPTHSWVGSKYVRRVARSDFQGWDSERVVNNADGTPIVAGDKYKDRELIACFDTETRILHLSEPLSEDSFLVFEAHCIPGRIDFRKVDAGSVEEAEETRLRTSTIKTPPIHIETVLAVALGKLIPMQVTPLLPGEILASMQGLEATNGSTVVIPDGQYGGFGC